MHVSLKPPIGTTLIRHDLMGINFLNENNKELEPTYYESERFMADLASISRECRQYVKPTCKNMPFFSDTQEALASWTGLDDMVRNNWGTGSTLPGCPCSLRAGECIVNGCLLNCICYSFLFVRPDVLLQLMLKVMF